MQQFYTLHFISRVREERLQKADELEKNGKTLEARKMRAQATRIFFNDICGLIKV